MYLAGVYATSYRIDEGSQKTSQPSDGHKSAMALQMWLRFIEQFNAKRFILTDRWENSITMKLNSDASNV